MSRKSGSGGLVLLIGLGVLGALLAFRVRFGAAQAPTEAKPTTKETPGGTVVLPERIDPSTVPAGMALQRGQVGTAEIVATLMESKPRWVGGPASFVAQWLANWTAMWQQISPQLLAWAQQYAAWAQSRDEAAARQGVFRPAFAEPTPPPVAQWAGPLWSEGTPDKVVIPPAQAQPGSEIDLGPIPVQVFLPDGTVEYQ